MGNRLTNTTVAQGEVTLCLNAYALKLHVQLFDLLGLGLGG